jgi:uncharacterized protein (TIGR00661 family)
MARIFYSMAGEGRGHAARVRSMVELLRHEHELVLFAPDQAYDFLAPRYPVGTPHVEVRRIPGLRFHYTRGRLDLTRSIAASVGYLWKLPQIVSRLQQVINDERPDLIITDFEPALPRAAQRAGVPFISLNHQHFLVACDLRSLPCSLQIHAWMMSQAVKAYHSGQLATIVSSFFRAPLRRGCEDVLQIGPLLRTEVRAARPSRGDFLVSYLRPHTPPRAIEVICNAPLPVKVYGLGARPSCGSGQFCELSEQGFVNDLARCAALVGAAGNQTIGEALYLGKPVLALPEDRHHEQRINAHFLQQMGAGHMATLESFDSHHLLGFLNQLDELREPLANSDWQFDGNSMAVTAIQRFLPRPASIQPASFPTQACDNHLSLAR